MIFTLIIVCIILYWLCKKMDVKNNRKFFVITITLILIFVSGLRHESVGSDTLGYMTSYENQNQGTTTITFESLWESFLTQSDNSDKDPGYDLFIALLSKVVPSARWFLFIIAIITMGTLAYFVQKNILTLKGILFFYVYYISIFFGYVPNSAIRQSIAISFVILGYVFLQKQQLLKFVGIVFGGAFFHMSALISLLIIPLSYIKRVKLIGYLGIALYFLALLNVNGFASFFISGNELYNGYLSINYYGAGGRPIVVIFLFLGLYLISFLGLINDDKIKENNLLYYGSFLTLIFSSLIWVNPSLIRITAYFGPLMGAAVAASFNKIKYGDTILVVVILIFILSSLRHMDEYHFMWEHVIW